ncbi:hypothetical protein CC1G_01889 [Coprinopsis cinerea okayama7|uniref:Uncharacterized protein n=1 Tax=Coprinopsis cinerea (strain Okayama-7 / 130 / ATCC MYA-4618 / FGSC 9003) TaxID=240176 RepID=A8N5V8_COPC7|nr:hypothetical protein CC1G_01889 [Coprinopsis cinerea okayama7\|eukprot:XP_001830253.1 hypothetical protein CC1G_01889 [Coprinopsis cinerea okayama7\
MGRRIVPNKVHRPYWQLYQQHVEETRARVLGRLPEQPTATVEDNEEDDDGLQPSFIPPTGFWTAQEKDAFFQALNRYSRLRPDLIAASIKTKNVVDVCVYLDALEQAAAAQRNKDRLCEQERGKSVGGGRDYKVGRLWMEGAMEMSSDWVEFEELQARLLTSIDEQQSENEDDEEQGLKERSDYNDRNSSASNDSNSDSSSDDDSDDEHDPSQLLTSDKVFTCIELEAMETMLREAEDASMELSVVPDEIKSKFQVADEQGGSARSTSLSPPTTPSRHAATAKNVATSSTSAHLVVAAQGATISPPVVEATVASTSVSNHGHPGIQPPHPVAMQICEEGEKGNVGEEEGRRRGEGEEKDDEDSEQDEEDAIPVDLSPKARRRLQKRLYMRRQRALKAGRSVDVTSVKLRPGRKRKPRRPATSKRRTDKREYSEPPSTVSRNSSVSPSESSPSEDDDEGMDDAEANSVPQDGEEYAHRNKGGLTAIYKAKQQLLDIGIDAPTIHGEGIGFFHLSVLSKLINIFTSGYREEEAGEDGEEAVAVSADVIRLLTGITVEFVTEVIHRAVTITEQQNAYKRKSKVWRPADKEFIPVENIKLALEIVGLRLLDRQRYFAELLDEPMEDVPDVDEEPKETAFPCDYALHNDLNPPHVYLPPVYRTHDADDLMVEDEEGLLKEVEEEDALDKKELERNLAHEEEFWAEYASMSY